MKRPSLYTIAEQPVADLNEYARIAIAFTVDRLFEVTPIDNGLGGMIFRESTVDPPYIKDYDAIEGNSPGSWAAKWDISNWGMISAFANGKLAGGAVVAFRTDALDMLDNRTDLAVLWDIRVHPDTGTKESVKSSSTRPRLGRELEVAGRSKSRPRTSTYRRVVSMRNKAAFWERSTGTHTPISRPRSSSFGTRISIDAQSSCLTLIFRNATGP
jgi:hypothetical protein